MYLRITATLVILFLAFISVIKANHDCNKVSYVQLGKYFVIKSTSYSSSCAKFKGLVSVNFTQRSTVFELSQVLKKIELYSDCYFSIKHLLFHTNLISNSFGKIMDQDSKKVVHLNFNKKRPFFRNKPIIVFQPESFKFFTVEFKYYPIICSVNKTFKFNNVDLETKNFTEPNFFPEEKDFDKDIYSKPKQDNTLKNEIKSKKVQNIYFRKLARAEAYFIPDDVHVSHLFPPIDPEQIALINESELQYHTHENTFTIFTPNPYSKRTSQVISVETSTDSFNKNSNLKEFKKESKSSGHSKSFNRTNFVLLFFYNIVLFCTY